MHLNEETETGQMCEYEVKTEVGSANISRGFFNAEKRK